LAVEPLRVSALTMANTTPGIFIINEWVGQSILVHVPSGPSQYAIYNVVAVTPDTEWFFLLDLEFVSGTSGSILEGESLVFGFWAGANVVTSVEATFPIIATGDNDVVISLDPTTNTNWNTAYNRSLVSASVTGTTTKTLTLNKQDGGTITASWVDDNTDAVVSVFGRTGAIVAQAGDYTTTLVTEGTNLYFTDQRARNVISSSITGIDYSNTTGIFSLTTGYLIPTTTKSGQWDTAYNRSLTSAAVTGTTTKTLTLNQQDGGTITASWSDINTDAVTSVFGRTGAVVAQSGDYTTTLVTEGDNLYFTTARARGAISLTTTGTSGPATYSSSTGILNIPQYQGGVTSFNTRTGAITLTSTDVTDALTFTPENVANKSNDTALGTSATLYPTQNAVKTYVDSATAGGIILQGDWNAATNTPNITATTQTGFAWRVSVAGNTNLGGITDWLVNDLAVKSATGWIKIDNTESVTSVFGRFGTVVAQSGDYNTDLVTEGTTNLYFTTARSRESISAGTGITYNSTTGVISSSGGSVTSVGLSMPSAFTVTNSPVTSTGTLTVTGAGTTAQYIRGDGTLATLPSISGFVPYTGATANVDLGTHAIIASNGTFSSSGSGNTVEITHSSGSGIALNISKGGNGEGIYVNKTSGSGNAVTIVGTLNATTLVKNGGTSSQFLKADGSVDNTAYGTVTSVGLALGTSGTDANISNSPITTTGEITLNLPTASATNRGLLSNGDWTTFNSKQTALNGTGFVKMSETTVSYITGTASQILAADGSLISAGSGITISGGTISATGGASTSARTEQTFTSTAGTNTFTITGGYVVGLIDVYVNGVKYPPADYTASNGTTVVIAGLVAADIVSVITYTANITVPSISGSGTANSIARFVGSTAIGDSGITDNGTTVTLVSRALSGTSATFSGAINLTGTANSFQVASIFRNANRVFFGGDTGGYFFQNSANSATVLQIADSGAATFSSSITANGNAFLSSTNTSGGVGIGTSSIVTSYPGSNILQIGTRGFIQNVVGNQMMISNNAYLNPDGWRYATSANAQAIRFGAQAAGDISFHSAPSGTAGNAISNWDTSDIKMYIAPAGNVGIGTTAPATKLHIYEPLTNSAAYLTIQNNRARNAAVYTQTTNGGFYAGTSIGTDTFNYQIYDGVAGAARLTISSTGAATFSSSVTAGDIFSTDGTRINFFGVGTGANVGYVGMTTNHSLAFLTNNTEKMRITSGGNVGIGTSSVSAAGNQIVTEIYASQYGTLRLSAAGTVQGEFTANNQSNWLFAGTTTNHPFTFGTNASERMRITSGGNVLIGTSSDNGIKFQVSGDTYANGYVYFKNQASTNNFAWYGSTNILLYNSAVGNIASINASSGAYTATSDINKKKDFEDSTIGLNEVMGLRPKLFRMKDQDENSSKQLGFIAQEVKDFIPQAYVETKGEKENFIGLDDRPIIAALTKAIQELSAKVTALENK
jgi:hypothetical protein